MIFAACAKDNAEPASNVPRATMANIIYDMQKAKAIVAIVKDSSNSVETGLEAYRTDILRHYNVNQSAFDSTWAWYLLNENELDSLLKMVERISAKTKP
jgi:hypothetical protein